MHSGRAGKGGSRAGTGKADSGLNVASGTGLGTGEGRFQTGVVAVERIWEVCDGGAFNPTNCGVTPEEIAEAGPALALYPDRSMLFLVVLNERFGRSLSPKAQVQLEQRLKREIDPSLFVEGHGVFAGDPAGRFERVGTLPRVREQSLEMEPFKRAILKSMQQGLPAGVLVTSDETADPRGRYFEYHAVEQPLRSQADLERHLNRAQALLRIFIETVAADQQQACPRERLIINGEYLQNMHPEQRRASGMSIMGALNSGDPMEALLGAGRDASLRKTIVPPEKIEISFQDIRGQDQAVQIMQGIVDEVRYPEAYAANGVRPKRGVLMIGPPGTGKTMLAQALARETGQVFMAVRATDIYNSLVGESEQRARRMLEVAAEEGRKHKSGRTILLIDEIDTVIEGRGEGGLGSGSMGQRMLGVLTQGLDGVHAVRGVTLLAASNRPDLLDRALRDRFDLVVEVPLHDRAGRAAVLDGALAKRERALGRLLRDGIDLVRIAELTEGLSGRNLEDLVNLTLALKTRAMLTTSGSSQVQVTIGTRDLGAALPIFRERLAREERRIKPFSEA